MKNGAQLQRRGTTGLRGASHAASVQRFDLSLVAKLGLVLILAAALVGCGKLGSGERRQAQTFDGQTFSASAKNVDKADRAAFVTTVRQPEKSLTGAVEAASYQAVKYCITTFGTSDIDWQVGPDTPAAQLPISDGSLTLAGRCRDL